jgi:N-acetylmuramoyl-L-alanine amidase
LVILGSLYFCPAFSQPVDGDAKADCDRGRIRLVIDVGHTSVTYGATSAGGRHEFLFNLDLAKVVAKHLQDAGFAMTKLLIREGKEDLPLRAWRLVEAHPDLILSLHHDAVQDRYLKDWVVDQKTQHFSDEFSGYSIFVSSKNPDFSHSKLFATLLGAELRSRDYRFTMHHSEKTAGENHPVLDADVGVFSYDNLVVLRQVNVPAVLLEAAVIVNRDDEKRARDPNYQAGIADSVVTALDRYCVSVRSSTALHK